MELRFSQRHVTALNFLLIAALAYFAAQCVNDIVKRTMSTDSDAPVAASIAPRSVTGVRTRTYYDADVPDAGRLVSVEANRVIIDRGGRRVAIDIPPSEIPEAGPSQLGGPMAL